MVESEWHVVTILKPGGRAPITELGACVDELQLILDEIEAEEVE